MRPAKPNRIIRPKPFNGNAVETVPLADRLPSGGIPAKLWEAHGGRAAEHA
jgi:hypothetical protein